MPRGHKSQKKIVFKKVGIIFDFYLGLSHIYICNSVMHGERNFRILVYRRVFRFGGGGGERIIEGHCMS